jgi:cytosine/creatinine deaminase
VKSSWPTGPIAPRGSTHRWFRRPGCAARLPYHAEMHSASSTWLRGAALADGRVVDVEIDTATGTVTAVEPARRELPRDAHAATPAPSGSHQGEIDLEGYLLLPAMVEPHAHLDKALTAESVPNPTGDLLGAIDVWCAHLPNITVPDMIERARRSALELLCSGVTAVRTHVNVQTGLGLKGMEALLAVRSELAELIDIQLVVLVGLPVTGPEGADHRALVTAALDLDPSIVMGGCPHLDAFPNGVTDFALDLAARNHRMLDLHTDETLDPSCLDLAYLAKRVKEMGIGGLVAASHCVSLAMQPLDVQKAVADDVAAAGISVIALPQTNLFLQGRNLPQSAPRGLTAIGLLTAAGVNVAAGADNVRDPFNSMGRNDPFETASLLVMAGHLLPEAAYACVSAAGRAAMGLRAVAIEVGSPAELVAVLGGTVGPGTALRS